MKRMRLAGYLNRTTAIAMSLTVTLILVAFAQGLIYQIASSAFLRHKIYHGPSRTPAATTAEKIAKSSKRFLPDGTVHLYYLGPNKLTPEGNVRELDVYDANHESVWSGLQEDAPFGYLSSYAGATFLPRSYHQQGDFDRLGRVGLEFSHAIVIAVPSDTREVLSRWQYDQQHRLFTGYDKDGYKLGYMGANGFSESRGDTEPFGVFFSMRAFTQIGSYNPLLMWVTEKRMFLLDFERRTADVLFESPGPRITGARAANWIRRPGSSIKYLPWLSVNLEDSGALLIIPSLGKQIDITKPDLPYRTYHRFVVTESGNFMIRSVFEIPVAPPYEDQEAFQEYVRQQFWSKPYTKREELYSLNDDGTYELINSYAWLYEPPQHDPERVRREEMRERFHKVTTALSPPALRIISKMGANITAAAYTSGGPNQQEFIRVLHELWPRSKVLNWSLAMAMTLLAFWHGWTRRTSWIAFGCWIVFVALFSVAGLLTYLAMNHRPVIRCSACGKKRPLTVANCRACKAALPAPEPRDVDLIMAS